MLFFSLPFNAFLSSALIMVGYPQQYKYTSSGLTFFPYVLMSFMSFGGAIMLPNYTTLYIARSSKSKEATLIFGRLDNLEENSIGQG